MKRFCKEKNCIIQCNGDGTDLVSPKDDDSWKALLGTVEIRKHQEILEISKSLSEEVPRVYHYRKCCSIFTMKKLLDKLSEQSFNSHTHQEQMVSRLSIRGSSNSRTAYESICFFSKKTTFPKGTRNREPLVQCRDMRAYSAVRKMATLKNDSKVLALVSRQLIAAVAC